ncbi:UDP-glucuronosyltransferase 2B7-like [Actinia tenebrosa]|uniref:UDP-glucuronosyltransferase 2B7-like n=1 Tax=Actinia tenebrosa TaxID=6105 RepID=A0A6P8HAP0_ACTTE|nr:UDP-glucuronosyltransferase 2B7-like [Actinia tenebrosa]
MMPHFGRSHYMVMAKLGDELKARGHDVSIFVGEEDAFAFGKPNVKVFETPIIEGKPSVLDHFKSMSSTEQKAFMSQASQVFQHQRDYCDLFLSSEHAQRELQDADIVIGDGLYPCSSLVADKYKIPHVVVTMSPLCTPTFRVFGISSNPVYIPQMMSELTAVKGLANKIKNVGFYFLAVFAMEYFMYPTYGKLKLKHEVTPGKSIRDTLANADLVLMQRDFIMDFAQPIPPYVRDVGNFLYGPAQPLPAELEKFMEESGDDGVILVSFGSIVNTLSDDISVVMNRAFSQVKQRVIWKVDKFKGKLSPNVITQKWLPQNDILGHKKTRLFITHGGANGLAEASYHGVPMICSPFFGDQQDNGRFIKSDGLGEVLSVAKATTDQLVSLINQVIYEERYKKRASHVSRVLKLRPRSPVKEAADLIEYVQAVGNLDHLKPKSMTLPFYELYMLDVLFVLGIVFAVVSYILVAMCRLVCGKIFSRGPKKTKMS